MRRIFQRELIQVTGGSFLWSGRETVAATPW
jgi:hypothetical protein